MGYLQDVEDIAEDAVNEYPDDESGCMEYITASVDSSSNIINYHENEEVLLVSDNEPDGAEVASMAGPDADWRQMRTVAAYLAMEADVQEAVARLIEEREAEEVEAP